MTTPEDEKAKALEAFDKCKSTLLNGSVQSYLIPLQHVDTIRKALAPAPVAGENVYSDALKNFTEAKRLTKFPNGESVALTFWMQERIKEALGQAATSQQGRVCKCNIRTRLVGDGCDICNPDYARANPPAAEKLVRALRAMRKEASDFFDHTVDQGWVDEDCESDGITALKDAIKKSDEALAEFEGG